MDNTSVDKSEVLVPLGSPFYLVYICKKAVDLVVVVLLLISSCAISTSPCFSGPLAILSQG